MSLFGSETISALARYRISGEQIDLARVQAALRDSDEWWDAIFTVAGIGILFGSIDGEVLAATPPLCEMFGYTEDEVKAIGPAGLTHPDDLQTDLELFGKLISGEQEYYQLDKRYLRKNGSLMWGRLTVVLLRDTTGDPCFAIAMVEDITHLKMIADFELRLRQAEVYKKKALELNDDVLQSLVIAKLAFDSGEDEKGRKALSTGLGALKRVIDHMLAEGDDLGAGDFVRAHGMTLESLDD